MQREFGFRNWGGRRKGAGRKPKGDKPGVPHRVRARMTKHQPMHVTARIRKGLPTLRSRYVFRVLRSPREVRNALVYVLHNAKRHGRALAGVLDEFASGWWFDGWRDELDLTGLEPGPVPVTAPLSWLLQTGWWQKHGRIGVEETPAAGK